MHDKVHKFNIGNILFCDRLTAINHKIPLCWLNLSLDSYKIKCKTFFLNWNWESIQKNSNVIVVIFFNVGTPEGCIFSLLFYQSDSIDILYNWHSYPLGSSWVIFSIFHYASLSILCFHVRHFPLFCLTSFSTLLRWSIWKKRRMSGIWIADLPVAVRALYQLDHSDPLSRNNYIYILNKR